MDTDTGHCLGTHAELHHYYGVCEHGMGAIVNGLSAIIPYEGTFLVLM